MTAVGILTSRLLLRRFAQTALPALAHLFADTAVQEYLAVGLMGPKGARAFAETFIRASDDEWREGGCGVMAMVPRGGGDGAGNATLVGYCGLRHLPDRISAMEVVYALRQDRWGKGLATVAEDCGTIAAARTVGSALGGETALRSQLRFRLLSRLEHVRYQTMNVTKHQNSPRATLNTPMPRRGPVYAVLLSTTRCDKGNSRSFAKIFPTGIEQHCRDHE